MLVMHIQKIQLNEKLQKIRRFLELGRYALLAPMRLWLPPSCLKRCEFQAALLEPFLEQSWWCLLGESLWLDLNAVMSFTDWKTFTTAHMTSLKSSIAHKVNLFAGEVLFWHNPGIYLSANRLTVVFQ